MTIETQEIHNIGKCSVQLCFAEQSIPGNEKAVLTLLMQSYTARMMNTLTAKTIKKQA